MPIHSAAFVHESSVIHDSATIHAFAIIGENVEIGAGCIIDSHATVHKSTKMGTNNHVYSYASIGGDPQDLTYEPEQKSFLIIGDDNHFREFSTVNRGTEKQDSITKIGSNNMFMAYVHIAHDCIIGNNTVLTNNTALAGHVIIDDWVTLGGFTLVKQFCHIGAHAYTAMNSEIKKDIPPFLIIADHPSVAKCVNTIGLKRRGFSINSITQLKKIFKKTCLSRGQTVQQTLLDFEEESDLTDPNIKIFIDFIKNSKNGTIRCSMDLPASPNI
jgi:UDP-N-acetylglucosamine acyltransferase